MLVKNPCRHYPGFTARITYVDGKVVVCRGSAEPDELGFPGEEEEILTIVLTTKDGGNRVVAKSMLVDGRWKTYDEKVVNQLIDPEPEPKPEPEPEPKPEPKPEAEPKPEGEPKPESKPIKKVARQVAKEYRRDRWHEAQNKDEAKETE